MSVRLVVLSALSAVLAAGASAGSAVLAVGAALDDPAGREAFDEPLPELSLSAASSM